MQMSQQENAFEQEQDLSEDQEMQSDEKASDSSLGKGKSKQINSLDDEDEES